MKLLLPLLLLFSSLFAENQTERISRLEKQLLELGESDLIVEDLPNEHWVLSTISQDSAIGDTTTAIVAIGDSSVIDTVKSDTSRVVAVADSSVVADSIEENTQIAIIEEIPEGTTGEEEIPEYVEKAGTVNLNATQESYRSPRRAMFMSLLVPGTGQAYGKSYWKSGLFASLEIAAIVAYVQYTKTAESLTNDAHALADEHFSAERTQTFFEELREYGKQHPYYVNGDGVSLPMDSLILGGVYRDKVDDSTATVEYAEMQLASAINEDFYGMAKDPVAVAGWDDAASQNGYNFTAKGSEPFYDTTRVDINPITLLTLVGASTSYGDSDHRDTYIGLLDSAEKRTGWSRTVLIGIITNHIVSAVDAYITTTRYNRELTNDASGIAGRISVDNEFSISPTGSLTTGVTLAWHF